MQQNFRAVVCNGQKLMWLNPETFGVPVSLDTPNMIGKENLLANAVYILLSNRPHRVCWMGELANDPFRPGVDAYADALPEEEFMEYYKTAWSRFHHKQEVLPRHFGRQMLQFAVQMKTTGTYLVNHSRRLYLDMGNYIGFNRSYNECPDPLTLLTACGNAGAIRIILRRPLERSTLAPGRLISYLTQTRNRKGTTKRCGPASKSRLPSRILFPARRL